MTAPPGPAMLTTSPASKRPSTPVTPTASRLPPFSRRMEAALASTRMVAVGRWKNASRREERPRRRAREQPGHDVGLGAAGDEDPAAGPDGDLGRRNLADHAPDRRLAGRAAGHGLDLRGDLLHPGDDFAGALQVDQPRR